MADRERSRPGPGSRSSGSSPTSSARWHSMRCRPGSTVRRHWLKRPLPVLAARFNRPTAREVSGRLRNIAAAVDPALQLEELRNAAIYQRFGEQARRFVALVMLGATVSVLLLSATGIFAMLSFTVARRRREIGIRSALGAGRVLASVFARARGQLATGIAVGVLLALAVGCIVGGGPLEGAGILLLPAVAGGTHGRDRAPRRPRSRPSRPPDRAYGDAEGGRVAGRRRGRALSVRSADRWRRGAGTRGREVPHVRSWRLRLGVAHIEGGQELRAHIPGDEMTDPFEELVRKVDEKRAKNTRKARERSERTKVQGGRIRTSWSTAYRALLQASRELAAMYPTEDGKPGEVVETEGGFELRLPRSGALGGDGREWDWRGHVARELSDVFEDSHGAHGRVGNLVGWVQVRVKDPRQDPHDLYVAPDGDLRVDDGSIGERFSSSDSRSIRRLLASMIELDLDV